jgi:serine/threonine protein kinase
MGVVYRAWQPSLGRQVALKKLLHTGNPKTEARFRREIRALGKVDHSHLVKIYLSGADGDQWFYAMELVEGANLAAVCDRLQLCTKSAADVDPQTWHETLSTVCVEARQAEKPLSDTPLDPLEASLSIAGPTYSAPARVSIVERSYVRHVLELVQQVAEAAHALHEAGIVHRDIKPGNIMVTADGTQAVLMDLGLAQLADEVEGRLTRTRQFVGTLRYASPQQVLAVEKLDRRTDVYSLGATLWELLTLQPLYGASDQTPTPELMERIQREEPERLRKYHQGIALDVEAVVLKCLEKDPKRRYATARELGQELRRILGGEPVQARPVGEVERFRRWCYRNPVIAGLGALAALLLVGGTCMSWYFAIQASRHAAEAVSNSKRAEAAEIARREAEERALAVDLIQKAGPEALNIFLQNLQRRQGPENARTALTIYQEVIGMAQQNKLIGVPPLSLYYRVVQPALDASSKLTEGEADVATKQLIAAIYRAKGDLILRHSDEKWPFADPKKEARDAYEKAIQLDNSLTELLRQSWRLKGWKPEDADRFVEDRHHGRYNKRLVRQVGSEKVVVVAVPQSLPDDPPTFYIMENKVWNDLYAVFVADRKAKQLLQKYTSRPNLLRGNWRKGGLAYTFNPDPDSEPFFGVQGPDKGRLPVFRTTVTEAHCFAEWLGGRLPSRQQWRKAAGWPSSGPFGAGSGNNHDLAIGSEDGPWPVDRGRHDLSIYECRQMGSNGFEWTRDLADDEFGRRGEIPLAEMPQYVFTEGQSYLSVEPLSFAVMATEHRVEKCTAAPFDVTFRVVLEQ